MSYWSQNWQLWLSAFCVIAIYSYLYKDNPLYRTMVQIFIGIQVGYNVIVQWRDILYPRWWLPMLDGFDAIFLGGTGSPWGAMWALVGLLGLLWYFQLSRKYLWLSRIVIGVVIGIGAGITFKTQIGTNLPQLTNTFRPLGPSAVGPQPLHLFDLPPATLPPAYSGSLGVFAERRTLTCVEILNGTVLWRTDLDVAPQRMVLGETVEVWTGDSAVHLELPTGAPSEFTTIRVEGSSRSISPTEEQLSARAGRPEQNLEDGIVVAQGDEFLTVSRTKDRLVAHSTRGQEVWSIPFAAQHSLYSNFTFLAADGSVLRSIDLTSGGEVFAVDLGSEITAAPVLARMKEPIEDRLYVAVPLEDGRLVGVMARANAGINRTAGEVLWSARMPRQIAHQHSEEGVLLVTGGDGGGAYELPRPTKKLGWIDYVNNWIFVFTVIAVMTYFFFSFKQTAKPVQWTATYGRWALMIAFGAFFGNTVMTRMSYLLDRLMFLIDEWLKPMF